jgi:hypothetical protein
MTTTPQHHLIIRIQPQPASLSNERDILLAYDITAEDIEPAVLALARRQGTDGMHRAARLAATNRALRQHGRSELLMLQPQPCETAAQGSTLEQGMKIVQDMPLCKDELCGMAAIGLNEAEYRAIKGTAGILLDMHLDRLAHFKIKALCKKNAKPQESILRYARMRLLKSRRNSKLSV